MICDGMLENRLMIHLRPPALGEGEGRRRGEGGRRGVGGCGYRGLVHWTRIKAVEEALFIPGASVTGAKGPGPAVQVKNTRREWQWFRKVAI